jgi:hypothetical protein
LSSDTAIVVRLASVVLGDGDRLEHYWVLGDHLSERWKPVTVIAVAKSPTALLTYQVDDVPSVMVVVDDLSQAVWT